MATLYAHRGAAAEEPENTLPSFRRALELGADALELDVHMTSDGHVVVSHDPSGARMSAVPEEFRRATLATVRGWDAGWGFVAPDGGRPFAQRGYRFPTLEEVLVELPGVPLNVDLKQESPSLVDRVLALLRAQRAEERVLLASFSRATLRAVRRRYPGRTGLAQLEVALLLATPRALLRGIRGSAAQLPVHVAGGRLSLGRASVIAKCHALGLRVDYWTVNDPAEATRLLALGADGIMTDDPRRIAPVMRG